MNKRINDNGYFRGGYFVNNTSILQSDYTPGSGFTVTHKKSKALLECIVALIAASKNYIKICSFILDNQDVVSSLKSKMKLDGLAVFILTAVNSENIKSSILDEDEDLQFSKSRHFEFIDDLIKNGAHVRASSNAHAKFVICDGVSALLTTANITDPSLISNENGCIPNDESGIIIQCKEDINVFEKLFDSIFLYGTEFGKFMSIGDTTQLIHRREIDIKQADLPSKNSSLVWTYENYDWMIYDYMRDLVNLANKSINISTYCVKDLNNLSELIENLSVFLKKKNVSVKLFCRAMNHRSDHLLACQKLSELGVEIYGDVYNHSKGICVDDRLGMIFTANLDGKHGLKGGFEVAYKLSEEGEFFSHFKSFLLHQINGALFKFKLTPTKSELFNFYKTLYQEKRKKYITDMPDMLEIAYKRNSAFAHEFRDNIENYPIFYSQKFIGEKVELKLEINGQTYLLDKIKTGSFELKSKLKYEERITAEKYLLFYKEINLWGYES